MLQWILYITSLVLPLVGACLLILSLYSAIRVVIARSSAERDTTVKPRIKIDFEFSGGQSSGQTPPWLLFSVIGTIMVLLGLSTARNIPYDSPLRYYDNNPLPGSAGEAPADQGPADPTPTDPMQANPPAANPPRQ